MGATLMENFEIPSLAVLPERGVTLDARVTSTLGTFTENAISRKMLSQRRILNGFADYHANAIAIPATKAFYLSFRISYPFAAVAFNEMSFTISTVPDNASLSGNNIIASLKPGSGTTFNLYPLGVTTGPFAPIPVNKFATIEVRRDANGTTRIWANDVLVYLAGQISNAPAANFVYMGIQVVGPTAGGAPYGFDISDLVVVDPATPGLQNRPGSKARVVSVPFTADVIAEWTPPAGVTDPHYSLMADFPVTPDVNKILTGRDAGTREQYQPGAVPVVVPGADKVLSIQIEQRAANPGGVPHTFATEVDVGAGISEMAQTQVAAGGAFVYRPVFLDKKPDGTPWSTADVTAAKIGFSVKS